MAGHRTNAPFQVGGVDSFACSSIQATGNPLWWQAFEGNSEIDRLKIGCLPSEFLLQ